MYNKGHSDEVFDGDEEHVTGKWRKSDPCYSDVDLKKQKSQLFYQQNEFIQE